MRYLVWVAVIAGFLVSSSAVAQQLDQYLTAGPVPDWVEQIDRPTQAFDLGRDREINYLLVDRQIRYGESGKERYVHYVDQLLSAAAVEQESTLTIAFDPAYQKVVFHSLRRIRDGQEADILDLAQFDVYRVETDRDRLIYNGDLQASYLIPDIRPGDILEYSYTVKGKNPAFGPHFTASFQHRYSVPVQHMVRRVLFPAGTDVFVKRYGDPEPAGISQIDGMTAYGWDMWDVPAVDVDDNTPAGYELFPSTRLSSFASWQAVGAYAAQFYDPTQSDSEKVRRIAADIRTQQQTPRERLRAALDFVQREIRYLGIELGQGGYIPRQPDEVLRNRFGDCKDMTLLLVAILDELGIEADPLLVNSETNEALAESIPTLGAFDHVIVAASIDDERFFLDPTRGPQLGDLDHLQQGNFGKGVLVSEDSPGLVEASPSAPDFWKDTTDTYDTVSEDGAVLLSSVSTYRMGAADGTLSWYRGEGATAVEKGWLQYFQNSYPDIEQLSPLKLEVNEAGAEVSLTGSYRIPDAWDADDVPGKLTFYAQANEVLQDMPSFVGAARTMPYALQYPVATRQTLKFILDDSWNIEDAATRIDRPAFLFSKKGRFADNIYTREIVFRTKSGAIAPEDFRESMSYIRDARDEVGVTLTTPDPAALGAAPAPSPTVAVALLTWFGDNAVLAVTGWQLLAFLVSTIVALRLFKRPAAWHSAQVFHPISVTKFVVLSLVSLGVYTVFWSYANWRWLRDFGAEDISPAGRAFFAPITNFSLFEKMGKRSGGLNWFGAASIPLAVVILLGKLFGNYSDRVPDAPIWMFVFSLGAMLAWVPAVIQVNRLNADFPFCIRQNSRFRWPAIGFLTLFAPTFILVLIGLWVSV